MDISTNHSLSDTLAESQETEPGVHLEQLQTLRMKYTNNPSIGYLNINSIRSNKFSQLQEICNPINIDIFCIDETKLTPELPTSRLSISTTKEGQGMLFFKLFWRWKISVHQKWVHMQTVNKF